MKLKSFTLTLLTLCIASVASTKAASAATLSVIADGLNNPRNFDFAPDGSIYLTESGSGGDGKDGSCVPSPSAQYIPLCSGDTASLLKITPDGKTETVIPNLPSLALTPSGEQAAGPADFKFDSQGNAYLLYGYAGHPNTREDPLNAPLLGQLYKVDLTTNSLTSLADFANYELQNNPDGSDVISNPYAMAIQDDTAYVVDGGGNTIYSVGLDGSGIKNVAKFPEKLISADKLEFPTLPEGIVDPTGGAELPPGFTTASNGLPVSNQSVPTGIAIAPDGSLTVSEFTYFPYPEGEARIHKVNPDDLSIETIADGFTQLTGVAYDPEGNLYALQHIDQSEWKVIEQGGNIIGDVGGSLIKIAPNGDRTTIWSGDGLQLASGLTFGPDGNLYTSNNSRLSGTGQLIKIDLSAKQVPEPTTVLGLLAAAAFSTTSLAKRKRKFSH
ncbi:MULTISPECIES: ScyD/ScyE family protein [unclassified Nodularia (in: cyanobacteria)]|uniref:ScyD/ScyE family protein n=1 Tax=unclassified Nodularia (in: cyanobacteria) TaxID=2656917 RepID=UPI001882D833|nr:MULTISPECIES: ScyD/ScyE family protein [unclassified Nodularia (in: cyanobacteria)]MBE9200929.1 ScyD/ScyE family protein [Nodularia sp. LEGE 06071]MCC2692485.1 ScyD/ScyE family protein [Nodularia sp. LEGE 04288]